MTEQGQIAGLSLKEQIPLYLPPKETIPRIKVQGDLVYIPRPFAWFRKSTIKVNRLERI